VTPTETMNTTHNGAFLDKIVLRLTRAFALLAGIAALGLAAHMVVDVCLRFFFNTPIEGTLEYVTYWWMPCIVFFGLALTQRRAENIDLPMLHERLTGRTATVSSIIAHVLTVLFVGLIGWYGLENALAQTAVGEFTSATNTLVWPMRWVVPVGIAILVLQLLADIRQTLRQDSSALVSKEAVNENEVFGV
jgi:TRAP-type C4-dicarboxylate transport system permease small subunit